MRAALSGLVERVRSWWAVESAEERVEGSGEVYLDPAYNGRYAAERELKRLARSGDDADSGPDAGEHSREP